MALPIEFYVYVGYGLFAMIVVIVGMNFILGGLLGPFFRVKRSRGKMLLIRVRNPVQDYFKAGSVEEGWLTFTDREKNKRRIKMVNGVVSRAATVFWCEVDDEKNCFYKRDDGSAVSTYDAVKTDSLLTRALYKPMLQEDKLKVITLILVILALLVIIVTAVLVFRSSAKVDLVLATVQSMKAATQMINGTTGQVI